MKLILMSAVLVFSASVFAKKYKCVGETTNLVAVIKQKKQGEVRYHEVKVRGRILGDSIAIPAQGEDEDPLNATFNSDKNVIEIQYGDNPADYKIMLDGSKVEQLNFDEVIVEEEVTCKRRYL